MRNGACLGEPENGKCHLGVKPKLEEPVMVLCNSGVWAGHGKSYSQMMKTSLTVASNLCILVLYPHITYSNKVYNESNDYRCFRNILGFQAVKSPESPQAYSSIVLSP